MQNYFQITNPPYFTVDFEYFRIPYEKWELMLTRLRQMGLSTVIIVVPWAFHENEGGTIDLQGVTNNRRNLVGLVKLCHQLDFSCILKVGPYHQNYGLLNQGLPTWLSEDSLPQAVKGWYTAISQPLIALQWPEGPILALHFSSAATDQELSLPVSEHLAQVRWPIWLRKRYGGVDKMNGILGTNYGTVSQADFPTHWSESPTLLEQDAKLFLAEQLRDKQAHDYQILLEAGWQVPILGQTKAENEPLRLQNYTEPADLDHGDINPVIFNLQQPIQIDPDPVEVGRYPVWATAAPIRADGSLRRKFWAFKHKLWPYQIPDMEIKDSLLSLHFEGGQAFSASQDISLKMSLPKGSSPTIYRLRSSGELIIDAGLKVQRGKVTGQYVVEDEIDQTDWGFSIDDPNGPLPDFPKTYLSQLLNSQFQTLMKCGGLIESLSEILSPKSVISQPEVHSGNISSSHTLNEARRGLREADAALRKAIRSIGGLEAGFDSILGRPTPEIPQPAKGTIVINPEVFDGNIKDTLYDIGKVCAMSAVELKTASDTVQQTLTEAQTLTIERYQKSYTRAVTAASHCQHNLHQVIAQLRTEIATEKLPLVIWRVHDQIQSISKRLRWGVLRK
ncbi:MAG: beta-galactosidase [Anaerolineaceae bacterium]|nr:beta-galactosidase [Anaerolineaceae bacterium]MCB9098351.1 beta-galactosidase [Anaerolineales bacterium]